MYILRPAKEMDLPREFGISRVACVPDPIFFPFRNWDFGKISSWAVSAQRHESYRIIDPFNVEPNNFIINIVVNYFFKLMFRFFRNLF